MSVLSHSGRVACGELAKRGDGRKASFSRIKTYFEPTKAYFAGKITKESLAENVLRKEVTSASFAKAGASRIIPVHCDPVQHHFWGIESLTSD